MTARRRTGRRLPEGRRVRDGSPLGLVTLKTKPLPMRSTTAETGKKSDRALIGAAGGTCIVASLITSPVTGLAIGLAVAGFLLALRGRLPTVREVVKVIGALAVTTAVVVVLADWGEFKEGIREGFRRAWHP